MVNIQSQIEMTQELNQYVEKVSLRENDLFSELRQITKLDSHAVMQITPLQAQFLSLLVKMIDARRTIDIGTYTGYSSLAVALSLPNNSLTISCDINPIWTSIAEKFWIKGGVREKIELKLAKAVDTLSQLIAEGQDNSFDFIFIDADKLNYIKYFEMSLSLIRKGGLIAIDNTLLYGSVAIDKIKQDDLKNTKSLTVQDVMEIKKLNKSLLADHRIDFCLLPLGDGLTVIRKK
jgi:caffeoyl-CoA O-methyltransferase